MRSFLSVSGGVRGWSRGVACGVLAVSGLVAVAGIEGCASGGGQAPAGDTADYEKLYQRREYAKAYQSASSAYTKATDLRQRERAALTAGLASAALEPPKEADAQRWLSPLVQSTDNRIAGTAAGTLGMIEQKKGRHTPALTLLTAASEKLTGNDQARAAMFAGDSLQALGKTAEARAMYDKAATAGSDRLLSQQIEARRQTVANDGVRASGAFTLQLGSFSDINKANAAAVRLRPKAVAGGLPPPRVLEVNNDGRKMYAVRIGRFATRAEAQTAQDKLPGEQIVVRVATGE